MFKKDLWARELLAKMALYEISQTDVAEEMGVSRAYLALVFSGRAVYDGSRGGNARERVQAAVSRMIEEKTKAG